MGIEEITNIRLQICKFEPQIAMFYDQYVLCLLSKYHTWLNLDSAIYELGKTSKMDSTVEQSLGYFYHSSSIFMK